MNTQSKYFLMFSFCKLVLVDNIYCHKSLQWTLSRRFLWIYLLWWRFTSGVDTHPRGAGDEQQDVVLVIRGQWSTQ